MIHSSQANEEACFKQSVPTLLEKTIHDSWTGSFQLLLLPHFLPSCILSDHPRDLSSTFSLCASRYHGRALAVSTRSPWKVTLSHVKVDVRELPDSMRHVIWHRSFSFFSCPRSASACQCRLPPAKVESISPPMKFGTPSCYAPECLESCSSLQQPVVFLVRRPHAVP
jgi:hypothetical protein